MVDCKTGSDQIRIECRAIDSLPLDVLEEFQGNLKKRSKADIQKIITSIEKYGFSFPFFVWNGTGHNYVLDGHGRLLALAEMRRRGADLPLFPCVYVEAEDEAEAKQKLLRLNSQYGEMTLDSVMEFMGDLEINGEELSLSGIDIPLSAESISEEDDIRITFGDERDGEPIEKLLSRYENIIISFSGGKDSIATALFVRDMGFASKSRLLFCHVPVFSFDDEVEYAKYAAGKIGIPLEIVQASEDNNGIIQKIKKRGYPGRMLNWCNSDYKVKPMNDYYKKLTGSYIMVIGNRAEESEKRADQRPRGIWNGRDFVYPINDLKTNDVVSMINKEKIAAHHVYRVFSRYSCSICYQQTKGKWKKLRDNFPGEYAKALDLYADAMSCESFRATEYAEQLIQNIIKEPRDDENDYSLKFDAYWKGGKEYA